MSLLEVDDASVKFEGTGGAVRALDGVSVRLEKGETLAVVGESGCGKTTLARAILGLQPLSGGSIKIGDRNVVKVSPGQAATVGMVWQDPFASIDPRWRVRDIVAEPLRLAGQPDDIKQILDDVGLDGAMADRYPHQLSGGQRQRVAIGRALALRPPLVICDEPTAALDLSMQAQILNLLRDIQKNTGCAFLYISHDLTTVRFLADRLAVMYLGRVVEDGPAESVFSNPMHPYTAALMASAPTLETLGQLPEAAKGEIPDPRQVFVGCRVEVRCDYAKSNCGQSEPPTAARDSQRAACFYPL